MCYYVPLLKALQLSWSHSEFQGWEGSCYHHMENMDSSVTDIKELTVAD